MRQNSKQHYKKNMISKIIISFCVIYGCTAVVQNENKLTIHEKFELIGDENKISVKHYYSGLQSDSVYVLNRGKIIYSTNFSYVDSSFLPNKSFVVFDEKNRNEEDLILTDSVLLIPLKDINNRTISLGLNLTLNKELNLDGEDVYLSSAGRFYFNKNTKVLYVLQSNDVDQFKVNLYKIGNKNYSYIKSIIIKEMEISDDKLIDLFLTKK